MLLRIDRERVQLLSENKGRDQIRMGRARVNACLSPTRQSPGPASLSGGRCHAGLASRPTSGKSKV